MKAKLQDLIGNPKAFATQNKDGTWVPHRKPPTAFILGQHRKQKLTVGTYVLDGDKAKTLVFDLDGNNDRQMRDWAACIIRALTDLGIPPTGIATEYSGRKGYHVWVVLNQKVEASILRRLGRAVLGLSQVKCEVFPKQDESRDLGNLIKLPEGVHQVSGKENHWLSGPPDITPAATIRAIVAELPEEPKKSTFVGDGESAYPCLGHIQEGVEAGSRNNALFHLATMLRRQGLTEENVHLVVKATYAKMDQTDFPEEEVDTLLMSSANSGPLCNSLDEDLHCGDLCMFRRSKGLKVRPGACKNVRPGEGVVVVLTDREGKAIDFEHPDLVSGVGTLK